MCTYVYARIITLYCLTDTTRWVVNSSSTPLTEAQQSVLSRGLNFAVTPSNIPTAHLVSSVEAGLRNIPCESANNLRAKIVNLLRKPWYPAVNLKPDERRALKALKQSEDVVILSAKLQ